MGVQVAGQNYVREVLILILMEDTLWVSKI